jgi:hypothetical protein
MKQFSYAVTLAAALTSAGLLTVSRAQAQGICGDEVTAGGWVVTGPETTSNFGLNGGVKDTVLLQGQLDFVHAETDCHVFGPLVDYNKPGEFVLVDEFEQCEGETCRQLIYDVTIQLDGATVDGTAYVVVCDNGEGLNAEPDTFSIAVVNDVTGELEVDCSVECTELVGGDVQLHVYGRCP